MIVVFQSILTTCNYGNLAGFDKPADFQTVNPRNNISFQIYLPQIIPQILKVFMHDNSSQRSVTTKVIIINYCKRY